MRNGNEEIRNGNEEMRWSMGKARPREPKTSSLYRFLFARNHGRTDTLILLSVSTPSRMTDSRLKWIYLGSED